MKKRVLLTFVLCCATHRVLDVSAQAVRAESFGSGATALVVAPKTDVTTKADVTTKTDAVSKADAMTGWRQSLGNMLYLTGQNVSDESMKSASGAQFDASTISSRDLKRVVQRLQKSYRLETVSWRGVERRHFARNGAVMLHLKQPDEWLTVTFLNPTQALVQRNEAQLESVTNLRARFAGEALEFRPRMPQKAPRIQVLDALSEIRLQSGEALRRLAIPLRNDGRETLHLKLTAISCDCTVASWSDVEVKAGQSVSLPFGVSSRDDGAPLVTVLISADAPQTPRALFALKITRPQRAAATGTDDFPLVAGQMAPDFDVPDMNGQTQNLSSRRGKRNLLLTFFPKCFTGGCTSHLSSLRDEYSKFVQNDTDILAVSVDPAAGEKGQLAFAKSLKLPFALVPDTLRALSLMYGAAKSPDDVASRQSVLIDKNGVIRWIDRDARVATHGHDVLQKMRELGMIVP